MLNPPANLKSGEELDWFKAQPRKPSDASYFWYEMLLKYEAGKVLPGEYFVYHEDLLLMTPLVEETR